MRASLRPWGLRRNFSPTRLRAAGHSYFVADRAPTAPGLERLERRTLLAAAAVLPPAAPVPLGGEFGINTHTAGSQELFAEAPHAVASDAAGNFVATWSSSGQDGCSWGVYAQQFDAAGAKRGPEFRVNQAAANSQWYPSVASDADGDFVVAWTSYLQDGGESGIYARRYNAAGEPVGNEFRVNSTTAGNQRHPAVAMDDDGDFVVAWSGYGQSGGAKWDVYAQRYAAAGAKQGGEFRVNSTTAGDQQFASAAADAAGNFVVAWTSDGKDGSGTAACARRYSAAGAALGGEFQVNTFTAGNQQYARVAADAAGDFVVTWASAGQDGGGRGVYAQRYSAAGVKLDGEFAVNETTAGEQFAPTAAMDRTGGFVITWTAAGQDGNLFGVYARAYTALGEARGGEFRVNSTTAGNQVYSSAAADAAGGFVVVWESDSQDGGFFGIYGQRYAPPGTPQPPATVLGRHLFYNDSSFDGDTPGADPSDDDAIATDKHALPAGSPSSFANFSSYSRGINGIMVDIGGLGVAAPTGAGAAAAPSLTAEDFSCSAGNGGDPSTWAEAAAPVSVTVRPGAGVSGSDRVTLVWADGAIKNEWLQLTVKANEHTRLAAPDVFFFGNLIGDTGDGAGDAVANRIDAMQTRLAFSAGPVPMSSPFDFNRDGRISALDVLAVRRNAGQPALRRITTLPQPPAVPAGALPSDAPGLTSAAGETSADGATGLLAGGADVLQ